MVWNKTKMKNNDIAWEFLNKILNKIKKNINILIILT